MTTWMSCAPAGPPGFDLDEAVLIAPDSADHDGSCWTSRATHTPWRESLWRTAGGDHVVGLDSGGAQSSGLDADLWRWVSPVLAEDWLRSQGLTEAADAEFGRPSTRQVPGVTVDLDVRDRTRLDQWCADEGLTVEQALTQAVRQYLGAGDGAVTAPRRAALASPPDRHAAPTPATVRGLPVELWGA